MISKTVCGNAVTNFLSATRRSRVVVAALVGLAMLASSIQGTNAGQTTQVREVDDPGRIAYESQQNIAAGQIEFIFPVVPAGHRLVIQHVSGIVDFQSAVSEVNVSVSSQRRGVTAFRPSSHRLLEILPNLTSWFSSTSTRETVRKSPLVQMSLLALGF